MPPSNDSDKFKTVSFLLVVTNVAAEDFVVFAVELVNVVNVVEGKVVVTMTEKKQIDFRFW